MSISHKIVSLLFVGALVLTGVTSCATPSEARDSHQNIKMASLSIMPSEVLSAPVSVQQSYQFNAANPDVMEDIPCYCGCGNVGHTSNYDCYVAEVDAAGKITFDSHALGCSICVDITQDVMRMLEDGKSPQEARAFVDTTYAKYGPSNIP